LAWTLGIAAIASTLIVSISSIWLLKKCLVIGCHGVP